MESALSSPDYFECNWQQTSTMGCKCLQMVNACRRMWVTLHSGWKKSTKDVVNSYPYSCSMVGAFVRSLMWGLMRWGFIRCTTAPAAQRNCRERQCEWTHEHTWLKWGWAVNAALWLPAAQWSSSARRACSRRIMRSSSREMRPSRFTSHWSSTTCLKNARSVSSYSCEPRGIWVRVVAWSQAAITVQPWAPPARVPAGPSGNRSARRSLSSHCDPEIHRSLNALYP